MTPGVKVEQWMRDAVSKMHVKACGKSCKRSDCEKDVEEATKIIASEYSQAHPPAGESAHEDGWVSVEERLPEVWMPVWVHGGIAVWDGTRWLTLMETNRPPIQWKVGHWMPLTLLPVPPAPEKAR